MRPLTPITVESWAQLEDELADLTVYLDSHRPGKYIAQGVPLFRGQANAAWTLDTTLERFRRGRISLGAYDRYLHRIRPAAESFTSRVWPLTREGDLSGDWINSPPNYEFMVYARHHGFPSPLLDWSQSPYIGLFFAFMNSAHGTDVALYAYVSTPQGGKGVAVGSPEICELGEYATTDARHFMQQAKYTMCIHRPDEKWEYCCHEEVFKQGSETQDLLRKYVLPASSRHFFLEKLNTMNINAYTLFGGEDALMHALAFKEISLGPDFWTPDASSSQ